MKRQKWLVKFVLMSLAFAILFSLFRVQNAKAWSTETTGLYLNGFDHNTNNYAQVGSYYIFATDRKILFYDGAGALSKTWNLPSYGTSANAKTSIIKLNSTFLIVAHSRNSGSSTYFSVWQVNVDTLAYTTIFDKIAALYGSAYTGTHGQALINMSGKIFFAFASHGNSPYDAAFFYELYPTAQLSTTYNSSRMFFGQTFLVPSANETDTFYAVTRHADASNTYHIYKVDLFGTPSITDIGQGGTDLDWGNGTSGVSYVYYIGYRYQQIGGNQYYTMMVSYTVTADSNFMVGLIRWNDTYIAADNRISFAPSSSVARTRTFGMRYPPTITGNNDLIDGDYNIVYVGGVYNLMQQIATITGFNTMSPVWSDGYTPSSWQGKTHYYTSSNSVGGYQPSDSNVGIELDYANGKAIADLFAAPNPAFSYVYWLSPPATSQLDYDFSVTIGQAYTYYGEVFIGGTLSGNGNYRLYARNDTSAAYALMGTGTFSVGQLNFTFIIGAPEVYWEINITMTDYSNTVKTIDHYILGYTSTVSPTPGSTIGDISGAASYGATFVVVFLPPLLIILAPALILGMYIGTPGFLGGLIMGLVIAVNTIWANVALWAIAAIIFAGVLLLLFGAGGVGTAGGTQPSIAVRAYQRRKERRAERKSEQEQRQRERGYLA